MDTWQAAGVKVIIFAVSNQVIATAVIPTITKGDRSPGVNICFVVLLICVSIRHSGVLAVGHTQRSMDIGQLPKKDQLWCPESKVTNFIVMFA